jgi:hypothetical protein
VPVVCNIKHESHSVYVAFLSEIDKTARRSIGYNTKATLQDGSVIFLLSLTCRSIRHKRDVGSIGTLPNILSHASMTYRKLKNARLN